MSVSSIIVYGFTVLEVYDMGFRPETSTVTNKYVLCTSMYLPVGADCITAFASLIGSNGQIE